MTPAAQTSEAGYTSEDRVSGAINLQAALELE